MMVLDDFETVAALKDARDTLETRLWRLRNAAAENAVYAELPALRVQLGADGPEPVESGNATPAEDTPFDPPQIVHLGAEPVPVGKDEQRRLLKACEKTTVAEIASIDARLAELGVKVEPITEPRIKRFYFPEGQVSHVQAQQQAAE